MKVSDVSLICDSCKSSKTKKEPYIWSDFLDLLSWNCSKEAYFSISEQSKKHFKKIGSTFSIQFLKIYKKPQCWIVKSSVMWSKFILKYYINIGHKLSVLLSQSNFCVEKLRNVDVQKRPNI